LPTDEKCQRIFRRKFLHPLEPFIRWRKGWAISTAEFRVNFISLRLNHFGLVVFSFRRLIFQLSHVTDKEWWLIAK
jgi:hypothetical protein